MKNLKVKLSVLALILGAGSAMAGMNHRKFDGRKWTKDSLGAYTEVIGTNYDCNESTNRCTETYPSAVNPNSNPAGPSHVDPISFELGDFQ